MSANPSIPTTQKAWVVQRRGHPSKALALKHDWPVPKPKPAEVLVKIQAAALNPAGWKIMMIAPRFVKRRPYVSEFDLAGVVVDANGSTKFKEGDEVYGISPTGSMAEYAAIPTTHLVLKPANITPTEASGLSVVGQTAWQGLFHFSGGLESGQTVFINGGSSSVGAAAIQIAKAKGLKVWASASGKNEEFVRSLGADEFLDYTKQALHEQLIQNPPSPKFHCIFDAVALIDVALFKHSTAYLVPNGRYVSTGPMPHAATVKEIGTTLNLAFEAFLRPRWLGGTPRKFILLLGPQNEEKRLEEFHKLVVQGSVKPVVDSVFEFDEAGKAYDRIMTSRAKGKVVVKVDPSVQ